MRKLPWELIVTLGMVIVMMMASPSLINLRRVSIYEERVAEILSFKSENWYLPRTIPKEATKVYYNYTEAWGQGGSSNTLRFRLPEREARQLLKQIPVNTNPQTNPSPSRPKIARSDRYEELVWTTFGENHGSEGGVWYDSSRHEFIFHHDVW